MGWIGNRHQLFGALSRVHADRDDKGSFIVRGQITSFLGIGEEWVIRNDAEYRQNGEWKPLVCEFGGGMNVTVI